MISWIFCLMEASVCLVTFLLGSWSKWSSRHSVQKNSPSNWQCLVNSLPSWSSHVNSFPLRTGFGSFWIWWYSAWRWWLASKILKLRWFDFSHFWQVWVTHPFFSSCCCAIASKHSLQIGWPQRMAKSGFFFHKGFLQFSMKHCRSIFDYIFKIAQIV